MWFAKKSFHFRGRFYSAGDQIPAEDWGNARTSLIKLKRIRYVDQEDRSDEVTPALTFAQVSKLRRDELDEYAKQNGIETPEDYGKKDELLTALKDLLFPEEGSGGGEEEVEDSSKSETEGESEVKSEEEQDPPDDDLFGSDEEDVTKES